MVLNKCSIFTPSPKNALKLVCSYNIRLAPIVNVRKVLSNYYCGLGKGNEYI